MSRPGRADPRRVAPRVAALLSLALAGPALAVEGAVGFGAGSQYSDNVNLGPKGNEQSAWMGVGSASIQVGDRTGDHDVRVAGNLDYVDYFSGPFSNDFILSMGGTGNWNLGQDSKWYAEDYYNQATVNALAAPVPTNRQDVNVLTTGPEWRVPLARDQTLVTGARYENFFFSKSDTSSQRLGGYGRWLYLMDPRRDVSLNAEYSATDFKSSHYPDFRRTDLFVRLDNRWQRASLELDGGTTLIQRTGMSDVNGALGRLGWHLPFNTHTGVDLYVTHQYTDVGTDILDTSARPGAVGLNNVVEQITGSVFYNRQTELAWHWQGMFSALKIAGSVRDEDYKITGFNRRYEDGGIGYSYDLREDLRASLDGFYRRAEYQIFSQTNTDRGGIATLTYKINSHLGANFQVSHTKRDSTFAGAQFEENRFFVSVGYNQSANPERLPGTIADTVPSLPAPAEARSGSSVPGGVNGIDGPVPGGAAGTVAPGTDTSTAPVPAGTTPGGQ